MNIKIDELMRLHSRIVDIHEQYKNIFSTLTNELSEISSNVGSSTLTGSIAKFDTEINSTTKSLNTSMERLCAFLKSQMSFYTTTNEEALQALNELIAVLNGGLNVGILNQSNVSPNTTNDENTSVIESSGLDLSMYNNKEEKGFVVTTGHPTYTLNDKDFDFVCAMVASESDKTPDDALATASVIFNRSDASGVDLVNVCKRSAVNKDGTRVYQFEVYANGAYKKYLNGKYPESVRKAVEDACNGVRNHNYYSFRSAGSTYYSDNQITPTGNRYK